MERAKTGKELLQDYAIDGKAAIAAYEAAPGEENSAAAYVLDAAAVQVFPDGTLVNRIHTIQKALEQGGIQDIAEVTIPTGAQVLALRTIKTDGTVLEPETIEGKDSHQPAGRERGRLRGGGVPAGGAGRGPFRSRASPPRPSTSRSPTCRTTGPCTRWWRPRAPACGWTRTS